MLAVLACLLLAGCGDVDGTGDKGYISGNGQITVVDEADRGDPIELEGTTFDGETLSLTDLRGQVVVVNAWWSQCPPCRTEMPLLKDAAERTEGEAEFVGLNLRDLDPAPGEAFLRRFDPPYPSIHDPDGAAIIAFTGVLSPRTIPATVVLDPEGRVAATVIGPLPSATTLTDLVEEAGGASSGGSVDG
jgi:thiol-disulfide isomerase/thioredoxin